MLKKLLLLSLVLFVCFCAFAVDNNQKIYPVDSQVYKDISTLYVLTGHSLPSTAGPWNKEELSNMVQEIDTSELSAAGVKIYSRVISELGKEPDWEIGNNVAMSLDVIVDAELYGHTYDKTKADADGNYRTATSDGSTEYAFEGREWWFGKDLTKTTPFGEVKWESWIYNNLYSFLSVAGQNTYHYAGGEIGKTKLNTNIICFQNGKFELLQADGTIPDRAFVAFGDKNWSVQIGRDRLNWGGATTGNLAVADTLPYYDSARATVFNKRFKYTYLLSFFPHKVNYYNEDGSHNYSNGTTDTQNGLLMYIGHRFEGRFFKDKVSLSLAESVMYQSENNTMNWSLLNPMFILHNLFIANNSNSTMTIELTVTPVKRFNIYGQLLVDQIAALGEKDTKSPSAIAGIVGTKYVADVAGGALTINPEVAYVGALTYLRNIDNKTNYGLDYVAAIRTIDFGSGSADYNDFIIGYKYGPDCMVGALNASWEKEKLTAKAKVLGIAHGVNDIWTKWQESTATSTAGNYRYNAKNRDSKWYTFDFGIGAEYRLTDSLELSGSADYVIMKNIFNVKGNDAKDFQVIVGAKYKIF